MSFPLRSRRSALWLNSADTPHFTIRSTVCVTVWPMKSWRIILNWLVLAYLFHTLGELCLSPVSLSFVTKVSPPQIVASVMGIYWAVVGFANKLAAEVGKSAEDYGALNVFLGLVIFTVIMGGLIVAFSRPLSRLTHGTEKVKPVEEKVA
ncbi:MAG: peptide MFS transporter [Bacteroidia bacterium]|nr:peptide MFS transporter [Bacteroidia bacterium]